MNLFQLITVPLVITLFARSIFKLVQGKQPRAIVLLGAGIWLAAAIAILQPELTIQIAQIMGIGRGADLILYLLVISFIVLCFYFYNKLRKIESDITEIVRQLAIQDATQHWPKGIPELDREENSY